MQHYEEQSDFRDALCHKTHRGGERGIYPGDVGADEGRRNLAGQWDQGEGQDGFQGQLHEVQAEIQSRRRKEQGNKEPFGHAAHAGHDVAPHLIWQEGQGGAKEERSQGAVKPDLFGRYNNQK